MSFTIVLPIKGTPEELHYLERSLPAAIDLKPGEIIIGLDAPMKPAIIDKVLEIKNRMNFRELRFITVEKTVDWNFQLAKILWNCYQMARYDKIYSFDVDSIPTTNIYRGYNRVGLDGIAVYSFTKKLRLKNLSDLIRYTFYRYRVATTDYVFSGNYWIYRPYFFQIVNEQEYKALSNGVDTYLTEKLVTDGRFKIVTDKAIGVSCMTVQNEDYPWRQFQLGLWLGANVEKWGTIRKLRRKKRDFAKLKSKPHLLLNVPLILIKGAIAYVSYAITDDPIAYVYLKAFIYQHPYLLKGYKWARANESHDIVKAARSMSEYEWSYQGAKFIRQIDTLGIKIQGTGSAL